MSEPEYEAAGFFLLRAPLLPAADFQRLTDAGADQGRKRMRELATEPFVARALLAASTDLSDGVRRLGRPDQPEKRVRRTYAGLLRYLTRMSTRPTPFGLFSGVAVGTFDATTTLRLADRPVGATRTRLDMGWLLAVIRGVEERHELLPQLRVVWNPMVYVAGGRAVLPYADVYGTAERRHTTVRATRVVQLVMRLARTPVGFADLVEEVCLSFPDASREQAEGLVTQLWEQHFLTSELRPPSTEPHPERHVFKHLREIPSASGSAAILECAVELAEAADGEPESATAATLRALATAQRELVPDHKGPTYQIDTALRPAASRVSAAVAACAAEAAECLVRLSANPPRAHHLVEYHAAFVERYGVDTDVPLLEVLSPELGLDAPPTYQQPPRTWPLPSQPQADTSKRDQAAAALMTEALRKHAFEFEVTDEWLARLSTWDSSAAGVLAPPVLDVYMQIQARSPEAIDRGQWRGVLPPASLGFGGRTFGRFFDLLGQEAAARLRELARREEALLPGVAFAELSYLPPHGRGANVTFHPRLRRYEIPVNTTPSVDPDHVITLDDVVVGATMERFYLRSLRLDRRLVVTQSHMLSHLSAPNVCRFLLEVSQDGYAMPMGFSWGVLESAPFLPRLARNNLVLRPAQWNLRPAMVPAEFRGFFEAVQAWRRRWLVPRYVYLVELDHRLLLDLEHPLCVDELREQLRAVTRQRPDAGLTLHEMLPGFEDLWLSDGRDRRYVSELVVPVARREVRQDVAVAGSAPARREVVHTRDRRQLPGTEWTFLKLYSAYQQHDPIIAGPLRELVAQHRRDDVLDRWFFIRYADPEPHLRLRFRSRPSAPGPELLMRSLAWGRELVDRELASRVVLDTYFQEVERYGGPAAMDVMERVFQADSEVVAELVAGRHGRSIELAPELVAVFVMDRLYASWGLDVEARLAWAPDPGEPPGARESFRQQRRLLCDLIEPWDAHPEPIARAQRGRLLEICQRYQPVVAEAADRLRHLDVRGLLWNDARTILSSVAHIQLNRLLGIEPHREQRCYAWWRLALAAIGRRPDTEVAR